jgi:hypothetical protein
MGETLEQRARRLLEAGNIMPGVGLVRFPVHCSSFSKPFIVVAERHGDLLKLVRSELPDGGCAPAGDGAWAALGTFRFDAYGWPGCAHCGATDAPAHGHGCLWWCSCTQCNGLFQCAGNRNGQFRAACGRIHTAKAGFPSFDTAAVRGWRSSTGLSHPSAPVGGYLNPASPPPWSAPPSSVPTFTPPRVPAIAAPRPADPLRLPWTR